MSHPKEMEHIAVDEAHCALIAGLVCAQKPARVLEFGFGTGRVTDYILDSAHFNQMTLDYTIVDNWVDFGGRMPWTTKLVLDKVKFVEQDESNFVRECRETYDFIVCDADHQKTHDNWRLIYEHLLAPGGIVAFHDVTNNDFPNLRNILTHVIHYQWRYAFFDKNSKDGERCQRGLLVLFKS